eukprot:m.39835 g.39835  ORF g.39835 m.39835 type:complete len:96 (+) comp10363_c0_seq2:71-358(+)
MQALTRSVAVLATCTCLCVFVTTVSADIDSNVWYPGYNGKEYRFQGNKYPNEFRSTCASIGGTLAVVRHYADRVRSEHFCHSALCKIRTRSLTRD